MIVEYNCIGKVYIFGNPRVLLSYFFMQLTSPAYGAGDELILIMTFKNVTNITGAKFFTPLLLSFRSYYTYGSMA